MRKRIIGVLLSSALVLSLFACDKDEQKETTETSTEAVQMEEGGFYTNEYGDKFAVGFASETPEDIVYSYMKSLAILDFSTAKQYVYSSSSVINGYTSLNTSDVSDSSTLFKRKMFKLLLNSILVKEINDTVTLDNEKVVNFTIEYIDFTKFDFYKDDQEEIFQRLDEYYNDESLVDNTEKVEQYLYDYAYEKYSEYFNDGLGDFPKDTKECELQFQKNEYGNWVISDDYSIYSLCIYLDGFDLVNKIRVDYSDFCEKRAEEEEAARQAELEKQSQNN